MAPIQLRLRLALSRHPLYASIPEYLAPCLVSCNPTHSPQALYSRPQAHPFSTTPKLYPRDQNRNRGVSALRRTGLRQPLSVSKEPLPVPQLDRSKRSKPVVDENHGLWGFFNKKKACLPTPEEDYAHGRSWTVNELRAKSWEDLHRLWWVCCRERNRISTYDRERLRLRAGYGAYESENRDAVVRRTMQAIKHVLTERWYVWEDARIIAMNDPTVDLSGKGPAYTSAKSLLRAKERAEAFDEFVRGSTPVTRGPQKETQGPEVTV